MMMSNEEAVAAVPTQGQSATKPVDFEKVDLLRQSMLLTSKSMADLLGMSRITYYNWVKGRNKPRNVPRVRKVIKAMLQVVVDKNWPTPEVVIADQKTRLEMLKEALVDLDKQGQAK
jgi:DNA-binding transcriptional regulator YiaG